MKIKKPEELSGLSFSSKFVYRSSIVSPLSVLEDEPDA